MIIINNLNQLKKYYDKKYNVYEITDENEYLTDVKLIFDLDVEADFRCGNLDAKDINVHGYSIEAENINANVIYAKEIDAKNINCHTISAYSVKADTTNAKYANIKYINTQLNIDVEKISNTIVINNLNELKKYYNKQSNAYMVYDEWNDEPLDVKLTFDLDIDAHLWCYNLDAKDINVHGYNIEANDIDAGDIIAHNIDANNIDAIRIEATDIRCNNFIYAGTIIADYVKANHISVNHEDIANVDGYLSVNGGE